MYLSIHTYVYIWYDMIWYDNDMIWYDMIWYDMIYVDMICMYMYIYSTHIHPMYKAVEKPSLTHVDRHLRRRLHEVTTRPNTTWVRTDAPTVRRSSTKRWMIWRLKIWVPSGKHTKNYGKSPFLMGKLTINGHVQSQTVSLPEGMWDSMWG